MRSLIAARQIGKGCLPGQRAVDNTNVFIEAVVVSDHDIDARMFLFITAYHIVGETFFVVAASAQVPHGQSDGRAGAGRREALAKLKAEGQCYPDKDYEHQHDHDRSGSWCQPQVINIHVYTCIASRAFPVSNKMRYTVTRLKTNELSIFQRQPWFLSGSAAAGDIRPSFPGILGVSGAQGHFDMAAAPLDRLTDDRRDIPFVPCRRGADQNGGLERRWPLIFRRAEVTAYRKLAVDPDDLSATRCFQSCAVQAQFGAQYARRQRREFEPDDRPCFVILLADDSQYRPIVLAGCGLRLR